MNSHTPTGRRPLPVHLPRVDIEIVPDEVRQEGLDAIEPTEPSAPAPSLRAGRSSGGD